MHKKVCKSLPARAIPAVRRLPKTQLYPHADHSITTPTPLPAAI